MYETHLGRSFAHWLILSRTIPSKTSASQRLYFSMFNSFEHKTDSQYKADSKYEYLESIDKSIAYGKPQTIVNLSTDSNLIKYKKRLVRLRPSGCGATLKFLNRQSR
ncbi:MAG: hypothetical protein LBB23_02830 [Rickettsiales bacterium]|nr:hypothetical protein [Rickettsiales bacterium]